ncbi:MAG: chaperone modulator CbpM [Legionellaceae bacterium]|nr:chaperone modulator CbpM [Legionellaceae bacterium]
MVKSTMIMGMLVDDQSNISFVDVCEKQGISEDVLLDMLDHGLLPEVNIPDKQLEFDLNMLNRIQSACRLQLDLGLNAPGVVLALELLDELEQLHSELSVLQRHITSV